ncbi:MAG: cellulase family glycosylhydrolase [Bacteroidota bacterium]
MRVRSPLTVPIMVDLIGRCASSLLLWIVLVVSWATPGQAQEPGFFRASGTEILDRSGTPVVLKGVGLGGWLMPEGYMLQIAAPDGGSPRSIRAQIEDLIGPVDTDAFFERFEANYVEEKDIAQIVEWGFDHIRLPFNYTLFFDPTTETFREEGFDVLDTFLDWCRTYDIPVVLDMHAAPGAQSALNIANSDGVARLWTEPDTYWPQTVAIWAEIARRYADETLIIGYDLINEPVTPEGVGGAELRALYEQITGAIREVDPNHIVFIEGNFFATEFAGLTPPFDDNMVYSFHKYWNGTGLNSIQYLLDLREETNTPLWLGETGENSNPWFHAVTRLAEEHRIGINWWTHKKIETVTSPVSAPFAPGYEALVNYWRGNGPRPTAAFARDALFAMAEGLDLDSCVTRPGVLNALFNPDYTRLREPVAEHVIPGSIDAVDYDLGTQGTTYNDNGTMATTGTPGGGNNGGQYRNDGVDIERSVDPQGGPFNVGWTEQLEWLTYTVTIEETATYDVEVRVASAVGGGRFRFLLNDEVIGPDLQVRNTGGWQNWQSVFLRGVELPAGEHILKLLVRRGDFNVNRMRFTSVSATSAEDAPDVPQPTGRLEVYPNPSTGAVRAAFEADRPVRAQLEVFDLLGREVAVQPWRSFGAGQHAWPVTTTLAPGSYLYRLRIDDGDRVRSYTQSVVVVR